MTEKLFRVVIRRYDDFPGHYHEYMDIIDCIVRAGSKEEIETSLHHTMGAHSELELIINEFKPYTVYQMLSHMDKELGT